MNELTAVQTCSQCYEVQCGTVQCSAVPCLAIACRLVPCGVVRCGAVQCSAEQGAAVRLSAVQCTCVRTCVKTCLCRVVQYMSASVSLLRPQSTFGCYVTLRLLPSSAAEGFEGQMAQSCVSMSYPALATRPSAGPSYSPAQCSYSLNPCSHGPALCARVCVHVCVCVLACLRACLLLYLLTLRRLFAVFAY